jgi:hypothetical protein
MTELARLAPDVDLDAATTQFRRAARRRRQRRWVATVAVVTLLATSGIGAALIARDDRTPVVAGPGPVAEGPSCSAIEAFASTLVPSRAISDYTGTGSPAELVDQADVVFAGTLTGELIYGEDELDERGTTWRVGYEVTVSAVAKGASSIKSGDTVRVWDHQTHPVDPDAIRRQIPAGAPVLVAATLVDWTHGKRLTPMFEGFATGCPNGPPLGAIGTSGTWPTFTTFESLRAALGLNVDQPETAAKGRRLTLYTHCGLTSVVVDGIRWLATPPIADVPRPAGWDFNETSGVFVVLDADSARFDADTGVTAHFRRAESKAPEAVGACR